MFAKLVYINCWWKKKSAILFFLPDDKQEGRLLLGQVTHGVWEAETPEGLWDASPFSWVPFLIYLPGSKAPN